MLTVSQFFEKVAEEIPDHTALYTKDNTETFRKTSYRQLFTQVQECAAGFLTLGIKRGDHVAVIANSRLEWIVVNLALSSIGACDVSRGVDATDPLIRHIVGFGECRAAVVDNTFTGKKLLRMKAQNQLPRLDTIVNFDGKLERFSRGVRTSSLSELMKRGRTLLLNDPSLIQKEIKLGRSSDTATIMFTTGTTGVPKGVVLSHEGFINAIETGRARISHLKEPTFLSALPLWHTAARCTFYIALLNGFATAFSEPTQESLMKDFVKIRPHVMVAVPRLWDAIRLSVYHRLKESGFPANILFSIVIGASQVFVDSSMALVGGMGHFRKYSRFFEIVSSLFLIPVTFPLHWLGSLLFYGKIRKKMGGRLRTIFSAASCLSFSTERFFRAIGMPLFDVYGLSEASPMISAPFASTRIKGAYGTAGAVFSGMEVKILGKDGNLLSPGKSGVVWTKGIQVMKGYYRQKTETSKVLDQDGWLNTGDLGTLTVNGQCLKILGRVKDIISLSGGENVAPVPLETALAKSDYIKRAVVLGQDRPYLAALIVPNFENLTETLPKKEQDTTDKKSFLENPKILSLIDGEIRKYVSLAQGFEHHEKIARFHLLPRDFEAGRELSIPKLELKRHFIRELYADEISFLFT